MISKRERVLTCEYLRRDLLIGRALGTYCTFFFFTHNLWLRKATPFPLDDRDRERERGGVNTFRYNLCIECESEEFSAYP